jgi:nucleoside-diphosphate-sugar epimerase
LPPGAHALVAGATGIVGRRIAEHLSAQGWRVTGLCRNPPAGALPYRLLPLDLTDAAASQRRAAELADVTHVYYAARYDHPEGVTESIETNSAMLRNLVDALEQAAPHLAHIHLVHGTKYYGHMAGPLPVPLTEVLPRGRGSTYYFAHEDFISSRQRGRRWAYSISRPHSFVDPGADEPRNLALLIAVYASVVKASGATLEYPGTEKSFDVRTQFTYVPLLARAAVWMSEEPRAANQAYQIVNGDAPRWSELWPRFAGFFGLAAGGPTQRRISDYMADKAALWRELTVRHDLKRTELSSLVLWPYGNYVFAPEWDIISSMSKARGDGFPDAVDSAQNFIELFEQFRRDKIIP